MLTIARTFRSKYAINCAHIKDKKAKPHNTIRGLIDRTYRIVYNLHKIKSIITIYTRKQKIFKASQN